MLKRALRAIFGNFWLKLSALAISVGIWFYADSRLIQEMDVEARLSIVPPDGYEVVFQDHQTTRIRVVGPRSLLSSVQSDIAENLTYRLTEQQLEDGWATLRVDRTWLQPFVPESDVIQLRFRRVSPPQVKIFVSPTVERVLPVEVRTSGKLPPGIHLVELPSCSPSQVTVRAAAVAFDAVSSVSTEELPIWDVRADVHRPLRLMDEVRVLLENGARATVRLTLSQSSVDASIRVTGEPEQERRFENVAVEFLRPPGFPYVAQIAEGEGAVSVTVRASPANLRKLRPDRVRAYVDVGSLADVQIEVGGSAYYNERVWVWLPPEAIHSAARPEPERVMLLLKNPAE